MRIYPGSILVLRGNQEMVAGRKVLSKTLKMPIFFKETSLILDQENVLNDTPAVGSSLRQSYRFLFMVVLILTF